ncbi:MAG: carbon-nitrogen hydrolase family protein [Campylobacterota bacterium]|nr:carbon-nitrogen hydrolase family protein [Campylobacterota bacterium]
MTSSSRNLVSLRFASTTSYKENLAHLIELINRCDDNDIIVAPEVCLTDYDYDNFQEAIAFTNGAIKELLIHVKNRVLILTVIEKRSDGIFNVAKVLHNNKVLYNQPKANLFKFGDEHRYFESGNDSDIVLFEVDGIHMGIMICFELRFKKLWQQLEGADIISVPSRWGLLRTQNFSSLTNALAIMNQCYVIASDSSNDDFTGKSGIINPFGHEIRNGEREIETMPYDNKEIKAMRRYMQVGIDD